MKKYIFLILSFTGVILFNSCSDMLDEVPKDFVAPENFFNNEKEAIQALNGVYRKLPSLYGSSGTWSVTEIGCDDIMVKEEGNTSETYLYNKSSTGGATSIWNYGYEIIMNANMVIDRVNDSDIDKDAKSRITGEAKFIRALQYYNLSNTFGDVPLWTAELNVGSVSTLGRTDISLVREQIRKDLEDAIEGLPNRFTGSNTGRVNKAAAWILMAKLCLIEKDWQGAIDASKAVIDMPEYDLEDNYGDVFSKRNSKESIFEVQYLRDHVNNTNYRTNNRYTFFMPPKDNAGVFAGVNFGNTTLTSYAVFYPSVKFVEQFEAGDARKNIILGYGYNGQLFTRMNQYNGMPFFGPKFWDVEANDYFSGKNLMVFRLADAYLIRAEAENELNGPANAYQWINEVRQRAGLTDLSGLDKAQLREAIMKERGIELCGEFQRKWDLIRWGKLIEAVKSVAADNPEGAKNIKDYHVLYPIHEDELIKNEALKPNNPGY